MQAYIKNNLKQTFLTLEGEENPEEDFRTSMLQGNEIPGLLKTSITHIDNKSYYNYDISGKNSLQTKFEREKLGGEDIRRLIYAILQVVHEVKNYMLDSEGILLDPEYIYCENKSFFFCYYPPCQKELTKAFHELTEYFVREVDYKDKEGTQLAYTFHKSSMEENYSVEKIMEEIESVEATTTARYEDPMEEDTEEANFLAEKGDFWNPVRKWLGRRRKDRWESYEDLPTDET